MRETDKSYIAGILDGEGCISTRLQRPYRKDGGSVDVRVTVQACSIVMIEALQKFYEELGVPYRLYTDRWMPKSTRPAHIISVDTKSAVKHLIRVVLPYLKVKRREALSVLEWFDKYGHDLRLKTNIDKPKPSKDEKQRFVFEIQELKCIA